ncbi:MAG: sigma factor [Ornithinibacter sp.]
MPAPSTGAPVPDAGAAHEWPGANPTADLLGRSAHGDETAFAEFYDSTCRLLLGLVRSVVRDPVVAEDVTREAYMYLWRHSARFEPSRGSATAWVTTIAYRGAAERMLTLSGPDVVNIA